VPSSSICVCICSKEPHGPGQRAEDTELGEQQYCAAPSAYIHATSIKSRLFPNKQLHQQSGSARSFNHVARPHVSPSVFNVGSSAISAANDNVDLSSEFFCQATETPSTRQSGSGLGTRTGSVRSALTHEPGNFGDGFLPVLQEDDGIPGEGISGVDLEWDHEWDDISIDSIGQLRPEYAVVRPSRQYPDISHSGSGLETRTSMTSTLTTQGRRVPGNFDDGFLPVLQEDDGISGEGIPIVDLEWDDVSVGIGRHRSGLMRWGAITTDSASCSTGTVVDRDFPVTWPDVNTVRSRRTVDSTDRSLSQEDSVSTDRWWLTGELSRITDGNARPRANGGLISQLEFVEDMSSSSSSSVVQQTVRLHRSTSDNSSPSLFADHAETFNEYFVSAVKSFTFSCSQS